MQDNAVPVKETEQAIPAAPVREWNDDVTADTRATGRYEAHMDIATRFLSAAEGSEEKALARAELATALAAEQGSPLQEKGGAALAILARRRRQQRQTPNWRFC